MTTAPSDQYPLEPSAEEMRRLVDATMAHVVRHLESLPSQPSWDLDGAEQLAASLREPLPEQGAAPEELLDLVFERAAPKSFNTAAQGYLAYIPGGGIFYAAVADLIADTVNRYTGLWLPAPALVQLEANVLRWFAAELGYPDTARGILTSGGSLANFSAIFTARRERLPDDFLNATLYVSDQVHHSIQKAAMLAGFPERAVRVVPHDDRFRMRLDALETLIARDRREGHTPFMVVGSGGTVNTGAVDNLVALADLARRENLWFHVDAAYGGFFVMTERGRRVLRGIEQADSVTLDPHKGLFLPYGTGCLLVRDGAALKRAHMATADYLPAMQDDFENPDFCNMSPELSRPFRGLRLWLPLKLVGAKAFRDQLEEKLDLTEWATEQLRHLDGVRIVAEPQLSLVAFRYEPDGYPAGDLDALNRRVLEGINRRARVYLTGTTVDGQFVLRICVLSFRTHRDRMEQALEDIRAALAEQRQGAVSRD